MKLAIALIILGAVGLGQYVYGQLTPLAYEYGGTVPGVGEVWVRNWMAGLVGAIIGAIFLGIGIYRLRKARVKSSRA